MSAVDERQGLSERAEQAGWQRREVDRVDVYTRGLDRVRVIWTGPSINGGSLYHDDVLTTYTRDIAAIDGWLNR